MKCSIHLKGRHTRAHLCCKGASTTQALENNLQKMCNRIQIRCSSRLQKMHSDSHPIIFRISSQQYSGVGRLVSMITVISSYICNTNPSALMDWAPG